MLSRALYGCELWYNLTNSDIDKMEVGHRFCLKYMQSIPRRPTSGVVESMVDTYSMQTIIELKKMILLGRLCRLENSVMAKRILMARLSQDPDAQCRNINRCGIVFFIVQVIRKHGLLNCIEQFLCDDLFSGKKRWKDLVLFAID